MLAHLTPLEKALRIILVLDTSVIVTDDHILGVLSDFDLAIPARVLEELDPFKNGNDYVNHAARHFIREVDTISKGTTLDEWIPLKEGQGRLKMVTEDTHSDATDAYVEGSADNYIVNAALKTSHAEPGTLVIVVSNDINLRLKAKALGIYATGYNRDTIIKDIQQIRQTSEEG